mmetsp:Transcript_10180/g.16749  ORF Transcript_10180/g.16749 Transcript_10180/m.16749 type:complete len:243 (-) Transcript_10180:1090-1818(-)
MLPPAPPRKGNPNPLSPMCLRPKGGGFMPMICIMFKFPRKSLIPLPIPPLPPGIIPEGVSAFRMWLPLPRDIAAASNILPTPTLPLDIIPDGPNTFRMWLPLPRDIAAASNIEFLIPKNNSGFIVDGERSISECAEKSVNRLLLEAAPVPTPLSSPEESDSPPSEGLLSKRFPFASPFLAFDVDFGSYFVASILQSSLSLDSLSSFSVFKTSSSLPSLSFLSATFSAALSSLLVALLPFPST